MSEVVARSGGVCPLLSALPVEIRLQIYDYVLFENGNFFSLDDEEGNSVPTLFPKLRAPPRKQPPRLAAAAATRPRRRSSHALDPPAADPHPPVAAGGNIMSLFLTSKQVYDEASSRLYARAFFRLRGIRSTIQFVNTVAPAHLALVRALKLVWDDQGWASAPEFDTPTLRAAWPSLCDALATQFRGLESLYLALGVPGHEARVEALYLAELRRVRQVRRNFKVCIPTGFLARYYAGGGREAHGGGDDDDEGKGHGEPFELCRHTAGEVCRVRREVIAAEWLGESRPSTPKLKEVPPPAADTAELLHPWADGQWEAPPVGGGGGGGGLKGGDGDGDWLDAVIAGKL